MKNNGFTLVELLGVIVVLSILITIISMSVTSVLNNSETKLTGIQIEKLKDAAKNYYINEGMESLDFEHDSFSHCVNVNYLLENGYVDGSEISNFETGEDLLGSIRIYYDNKKYKYTYTEDSCKVCSLIDDTGQEGISVGDKYQCKVKDNMEEGFEDGYYFYVLSLEDDGTTNLIMERNMYYDEDNDAGVVATETNKGLVAWYSNAGNHSYGPVTAMNYLHNATKDWDNLPNMIMNYEDENIDYNTQQKGTNGYGSIKTTGNITIITSKNNEETGRIENLKARLPRYDEAHGTGKCLTYEENGNKYGSCPLYLANYLHSSSYVTGEGLQNIRGIYGYWTLSSYADDSRDAWDVIYDGKVGHTNVNFGSNIGVRPVITIPKNRFEDNW